MGGNTEEFSLKEADEDMTNEKEEDRAENEDKEDEEDDMGDLSSLEIFKKVEKPTFEASKEKLDSLDEEEEASSGKGSVTEVEKPGPKSSYTPQIETEVSEVKNAEVGHPPWSVGEISSQSCDHSPGHECDQGARHSQLGVGQRTG